MTFRTNRSLHLIWVVTALLPLLVNAYWTGVLATILMYAIAALGLSLYMTFAGQVSLGHGAFVGVGAYTSAILTVRYGMTPLVGLLGALCVCGVLAYLVGLPALRLKGHYLAVGTLAFALLVVQVIDVLNEFTGGPSGLPGIPALTLGGWVVESEIQTFYVTLAVALLLYWLTHNWVYSKIGRALVAIHSNPTAAKAMGIPVDRYLHAAFLVSALYSGIAGFLLAHYLRFISPGHFGLAVSVDLVIMLLLGGQSSLVGPLLGSAAWTLIPEFTRRWPEWRSVLTGMIMVVLLLFARQGLAGLAQRLISWRGGAPAPGLNSRRGA